MHEHIIKSIKWSLRSLSDLANEEPNSTRAEEIRDYQKAREEELDRILDDLRELDNRLDHAYAHQRRLREG